MFAMLEVVNSLAQGDRGGQLVDTFLQLQLFKQPSPPRRETRNFPDVDVTCQRGIVREVSVVRNEHQIANAHVEDKRRYGHNNSVFMLWRVYRAQLPQVDFIFFFFFLVEKR